MAKKVKAINFGAWGLRPGIWSFYLFLSSFPFHMLAQSATGRLPSFIQEFPQQASEGEEVRSLEANPALFRKNKKPPSFYIKNSSNWIYNIDTLSLPFVDDFSVTRIKNFNPDTGNPDVNTIAKVRFEVNGNFSDSVEVMNDTTWYFIFDTLTQQYDSFPNNPGLIITFFGNNNPDSISYLTLPTDTDTVWSTITYKYNPTDTVIITLPRDTVYFNSRDTFFIVSDNNFYLWLDSSAFINNGFAVNPPTIGVATFDGLNANGEPYDFSSPGAYGPADFLTSKPIDLSNLTTDSSVILSFYYQAQGLGDNPDPEDSLALEFYSPSDSLWYWVWSTPGISYSPGYQPVFQMVKILVSDPKYLEKGFKFRFRNYAKLSGMLDIWNIDYVYLDKNRNINDNSANDLAFVSIGNSFINNYTSMPMDAFKENATQFMVQNFPVKITNLSNTTVNADSNRYFIYDEYETLEYKESANIQKSFAPLSQEVINHSVFSAPNNFLFTPVDSDRVAFKIKFISERSGPDLSNYNDTVVHLQVFDSYYAYDDGSAEGVYYLTPGTSSELKLAYKFNAVFQDTLRGINLFFPYIWSDVSQFTFKLFVWGDNGGIPGSVIFESADLDNPEYSNSTNEFIRYEINPPVALNGTYYIGWKQIPLTSADKIYLGFDKNINNQSKIFYSFSGGNWANTSKTGSLMMRPDFGYADPIANVAKINKTQHLFNIYPNPANDFIYIDNSMGEEETTAGTWQVKIYNTLGKEIFNQTIFNLNFLTPINISSVPNGIYFLKMESENPNGSVMKKLIIAR